MEYLVMLLDIYEEEVLMTHYIGDKIKGKDAVYLISKGFGFIERLVREGKIDYWSEGWRNTPNYYISSEFGQKIVNDIEKLIIHLSIIDQPIEYLCSILKE